MSEAAIEAMDSDAWDAAGEAEFEGEAGYDSEAEGESYDSYSEDARSNARWRARQQLDRRRQAQLRDLRLRQGQVRQSRPVRRPGAAVPAQAAQAAQAVRAEVRSLDLQASAAIDALRKRLDEANRLAYRNAWAGEASVAASQVLDSFELGLQPHDWARALIRGAPTLLISPGKPRRPGIEGILFDPRFAGGAVLAGIWAIGHFRGQGKSVATIQVQLPGGIVAAGAVPAQVTATARDKDGNPVSGVTFTFTPQDPTVFDIAPATSTSGTTSLTPKRAGTTQLIVTAGGQQTTVTVTIT